jgi:N6-adenosine-specific RNA methylase IME4
MTPHSNHYGAILADPPWDHITWSRKGKGRSAAAHYNCMPLADIEAMPVKQWAAKNCVLFLWTTDPMPENALGVIRDWGFEFKPIAFVWAKLTSAAATSSWVPSTGRGQTPRSACSQPSAKKRSSNPGASAS